MTITTSISTIGVVRATEMMQSARSHVALRHQAGPQTVSVEISRSVEAQAQDREGGQIIPASQKRVVDISV